MAYLQVANLRKSYRVSKTDYQEVLRGINVEFKRGELVAILGESGCGKSTFMNILGGLDNDYTGSIILEEEFFKDYTEKDLDDYRKSRVGLIFQNYNLINHMTIAENVEVAMTMNNINGKRRKERAKAILKQVGLSAYAEKLPNQLSGGQKQRVAIARALANAPEILLANEPTGALDKASAKQIMSILKKIAASGRLVIIVTHSQKVANECSRVLTIDDGVIKSDNKNYAINTKTPHPRTLRTQNIRFVDLFRLAAKNLWQTKRRSILVSIGMSIGLAAIMLVFCLSGGITNYVNTELAQSSNTLQLQVTSASSFTSSNLKTLRSIEGVEHVEEGTYLYMNSSYALGDDNGYIMMLNSAYDELENSYVFTAGTSCKETDEGETVCINQALAQNLYNSDHSDAQALVGEELTISLSKATKQYTIVGVYEDTSDYAKYPCAYLTSASLKSLYSSAGKSYSTNIVYVYVQDTSYISAAQTTIETLGYSVMREDSTVETVLEYVDVGTMVLTGSAAISVAVSAIMIFIVTYISIIERTKEIGILRAVGGRKKDVTSLFVLESAMIGTIAGLIAVVLSLFISIVANAAIAGYVGSWIITLNPLVYLVGLIVGVAVSVLAGLIPALQAAQNDPAESLRNE